MKLFITHFSPVSCHSFPLDPMSPSSPYSQTAPACIHSIMWVSVGHPCKTASDNSVQYILICESELILLQADAGSVIQLTVVHLRLPCGRQWLKVRDGDSLAANLVAYLSGRVTSRSFMSTSNYLLLDFFSDNMPYSCHGSFLARAEQRGKVNWYCNLFHALTT
jgi:CUB domain.